MDVKNKEHHENEKIGILIAGDQVIDTFFYPVKTDQSQTEEDKFNYNFGISHHYRSAHYRGGIHLIEELLYEVVPGCNFLLKFDEDKIYVTREIQKKYPIQLNEKVRGCSKPMPDQKIFRGEKFLGIAEKEMDDTYGLTDFPLRDKPLADENNINFFIINDIGKQFRSNEKRFSEILNIFRKNLDAWVILKLNPQFDIDHNGFTKSYKEFITEAENRGKLVIVVNLKDVRLVESATISSQLSWEKTTEELLYHLKYNPELHSLCRCKQLVVRLGLEGVLVINDPSKLDHHDAEIELFFDPYSYEDHFLDLNVGNVQGLTIAFIAGLVNAAIRNEKVSVKPVPKSSSILIDKEAIESGLNLSWHLWMYGYGDEDTPHRLPKTIIDGFKSYLKHIRVENLEAKLKKLEAELEKPNEDSEKLKAELEKMKTELEKPELKSKIRFADILSPVKINPSEHTENKNWTILYANQNARSYGEIAYDIVRGDIDSIPLDFPVLKIGHLITVDRQEIESLRSVKNILNEYLNSPQQTSPLSIAVFGPPGSGKSFAVKQLMDDRMERDKIEFLSFNLSQFTDVGQLNSVFHKIRDSSLVGKMPLVFFDEFDCNLEKKEFGWIKYFLAPMQDGTFFDGETCHPLGRAIFVFAGGVSWNYKNLYARCKNNLDPGKQDKNIVGQKTSVEYIDTPENKKGQDDSKIDDSKLRDFLSRLRGYIDIKGCDPDDSENASGRKVIDGLYKIKRGLVLRSLLLEKAPQIADGGDISIDRSVLRAFIKVNKYRHGVRSIQAIIEMSKLKGKKSFEPSSLPADEQLDLHVNATLFNNHLLRDIHYREASHKILDILKSREYEKNRRQIGLDNSDIKLRLFIDQIPKYLKDLKFGFYKFIPSTRQLSLKMLSTTELVESGEYKKFIVTHKKDYENIEKAISIIPELLYKVEFQLYRK